MEKSTLSLLFYFLILGLTFLFISSGITFKNIENEPIIWVGAKFKMNTISKLTGVGFLVSIFIYMLLMHKNDVKNM